MARTKRHPVKSYFNTTHSLLYSYFVSLPLLLLYELLIFLSKPESEHIVRISVDVWIKTLFSYIGRDVLSISLIIIAIIGFFVIYRERKRLTTLKLKYFFIMVGEATCYAFLLALLISTTVSSLLQMIQVNPADTLSTTQLLALSLGAGLYEELFFRVILVSALLYLFERVFARQQLAYGVAIVLAAAIFSGVHYIGALGDTFTVASFLFRFLFGLALNAIYLWRGFGMAAWTHAIYDLMVVAY